jgi:MoxR-like ATPase
LFNANSAILNNLLTVLNERVYRRGAETHRLPMLSLFSASNRLPDDDALRALFDRFLLRCHVDNLRREAMPQLLAAGWALEQAAPAEATITAEDLRTLSRRIYDVDLARLAELYPEVVLKVRDLGIAFSDRRAVKVMKLLAASALLCGRQKVLPSDLWVMRYVWDREEQIGPLGALVNGVLEQQPDEGAAHPLAATNGRADGEEIARLLDAIDQDLHKGHLSVSAIARLREQVTDLADRAAWVPDDAGRKHLLDRTRHVIEQLR